MTREINPMDSAYKARCRKIRSSGKAERILVNHRNLARIRIHAAKICWKEAAGQQDQIFGMKIILQQEAKP